MANYTVNRLSYDTNTYRFKDNVSGYTSNLGTITEVKLNNQTIVDAGAASLSITQLSDIVYPVGCYYETSDSTFDPNTVWGGVWELVQAGDVLMSATSSMGSNMIANPTADAGQSHDTYAIADFNLSSSMVAGRAYTVTAYVNTSSEKTGVGFYHSGSNGRNNFQPNSNIGSYFIPVNNSHIYTTTFIATAEMAAFTDGSGHGFVRVYVTNAPDAAPQGSVTVAGTANVQWIYVYEGYAVGSSGGQKELSYTPRFTIPGYAITTSQIKSHNHSAAGKTFSFAGRQRGSSSGMSATDLSAVVHESNTMSVTGENYGDSTVSYMQCGTVSQTGYCDVVSLNFAHTHTSVGGGGTHTHTFTGTEGKINKMQPYIAVNRWHKITSAYNTPVTGWTIETDYYHNGETYQGQVDPFHGVLDNYGNLIIEDFQFMCDLWESYQDYAWLYINGTVYQTTLDFCTKIWDNSDVILNGGIISETITINNTTYLFSCTGIPNTGNAIFHVQLA